MVKKKKKDKELKETTLKGALKRRVRMPHIPVGKYLIGKRMTVKLGG